jgi:DNA recombination protein RmuC
MPVINSIGSVKASIDDLKDNVDRLEKIVRDENEKIRDVLDKRLKDNRDEQSTRIDTLRESLTKSFSSFTETQTKQVMDLLHKQENLRADVQKYFSDFSESQTKQIVELLQKQDKLRLDLHKDFSDYSDKQASQWTKMQERVDAFSEILVRNYKSFNDTQSKQWEEANSRLDGITIKSESRMETIRKTIEDLGQKNEHKIELIRNTVDDKLKQLQESNEKKLDEMRGIVDEKLSKTLEERLGQSFKLVSDQLEQVYKNLGEMRSLSKDMGDIKNIFKNVKTRGTWGEVQLGSLLEQILTPEQYSLNVRIKSNSAESVEYAIKLPGPDDMDTIVWLPIDAKFPMVDYERLMEAVENSDVEGIAQASKALENRVLSQAREIRDKYIAPPTSTDFAIMFLPVESLFAEILRVPGLSNKLQQDYHVSVAGPTTLAVLLNSLKMGFRTLAIQKSSSEVWKLLGAVKKQFSAFADNLNAVEKHLDRASKSVRDASNRTGLIQRRLDRVEELPIHEAEKLLPISSGPVSDIDDDE